MAETIRSDQQNKSVVDDIKVSRKRKQRKKKDKNAPKRNKNAYMFFVNEKRGEVKSANPSLSVTDVAKEIGVLWRNLDDDGKKKYIDMANEDKIRYNNEMEKYTKANIPV